MFTVFKLHAPKAKFALVEMSRKRKENVSFLNIHPKRINERFSFHFISFHFISFNFVSSHLVSFRFISFHFIFLSSICGKMRLLLTFFTPLFMFIRLFLIHLFHLFYWSTVKTANDLPIFASYYALLLLLLCLIFWHTILALSYKNCEKNCVIKIILFIFCFSLTKGRCSKR